MNLQPYQKASHEMQRQSDEPGRILRSAATLGVSAAAGGKAISRVLPFLSSFIPDDLALKGLSKVNPSLGKFAKAALDSGQTMDDVRNFIKEKISPEQESKEEEKPQQKQQQSQNIIEQFSPELHEVILDKIGQGLKPMAVAYQVSQDPKFKKIINKMQADTGYAFSDIMNSNYGNIGEQSQQARAQQGQQEQQQQGQPQQAQGGIDPALMQIMQQMQNTMQKFKR